MPNKVKKRRKVQTDDGVSVDYVQGIDYHYTFKLKDIVYVCLCVL